MEQSGDAARTQCHWAGQGEGAAWGHSSSQAQEPLGQVSADNMFTPGMMAVTPWLMFYPAGVSGTVHGQRGLGSGIVSVRGTRSCSVSGAVL